MKCSGIVGITAYLDPGGIAELRNAAHAFGVAYVLLAWVLAIAIAIPYTVPLARHRDAAASDMRHPIVGACTATDPAAILVLAVATATVGGSILPAHTVTLIVAVLAAIGAPMAFAAGVLFAYVLFTGDGVSGDTANGGWFIPPVVAIIIPLTFIPLLPHVSHSTGVLLLLLGYATFGIGLLLFLLIAAMLFARLISPLPPAPLAPSLWIGLGPISVGSLALLRLTAAGRPFWGTTPPRPRCLPARCGHAMGPRAVVACGRGAAADPLPAKQRDSLQVGLSALTFPIGAYTAATLALARTSHSTPIKWAGAALSLTLVGFWLLASTRTVRRSARPRMAALNPQDPAAGHRTNTPRTRPERPRRLNRPKRRLPLLV